MTRGWLPQRAGLPSLNGSRDATVVPPRTKDHHLLNDRKYTYKTTGFTIAIKFLTQSISIIFTFNTFKLP